MKAFLLIIVSVVLTAVAINRYNSFTGTRAKSDDRSDTRTLRKQYDDLVLKYNNSNNTVKTQAKTVKDNNVNKEALNAIIDAKTSENNSNTVLIGKLKTALVNSQEYSRKLKAALSKRYKKKSTSKKKTHKRTKKVSRKTSQQIRDEKEIKSLEVKKLNIYKKMKSIKKLANRAKGIIGKKKRTSSTKNYRTQYITLLSQYKLISNKIDKLKRKR